MEHPSGSPLPELARAITSGAVRMAAATATWLRLVAEFDEREGWAGTGIKSCGHWLAWQCGMSPGAAREPVRVARALTTLPRLTAAFTEGRLSYSKVRALTRVAEPDTEESLLEFALAATASQTERLVRQWRRADAPDAATLSLKRQFEYWWDDDGMLVLRVRLEPDQGAHLLTAIDSLAERAARRDRAEARRRATADTPVTVGTAGDVPTGDGADEDDQVALARERTTARRCAALVQLAEAAVDLDRCPGTHRGGRWSCTSMQQFLPTTRRRGVRTSRAGRPSTPAKCAGCSAAPRWCRCWNVAARCSP